MIFDSCYSLQSVLTVGGKIAYQLSSPSPSTLSCQLAHQLDVPKYAGSFLRRLSMMATLAQYGAIKTISCFFALVESTKLAKKSRLILICAKFLQEPAMLSYTLITFRQWMNISASLPAAAVLIEGNFPMAYAFDFRPVSSRGRSILHPGRYSKCRTI